MGDVSGAPVHPTFVHPWLIGIFAQEMLLGLILKINLSIQLWEKKTLLEAFGNDPGIKSK